MVLQWKPTIRGRQPFFEKIKVVSAIFFTFKTLAFNISWRPFLPSAFDALSSFRQILFCFCIFSYIIQKKKKKICFLKAVVVSFWDLQNSIRNIPVKIILMTASHISIHIQIAFKQCLWFWCQRHNSQVWEKKNILAQLVHSRTKTLCCMFSRLNRYSFLWETES